MIQRYVDKLKKRGVTDAAIISELIDVLSGLIGSEHIILISEDEEIITGVAIGTDYSSSTIADALEKEGIPFDELMKSRDNKNKASYVN